ncbi:hypothetical protein RSAG8_00860, partial [Rhizoctonia solani AG-8 WAC10335]
MGCLGLISVGGELFLSVVTLAGVIGNLTPHASRQEQVSKIREVAFFSLNTSTYDDLSLASNAPTSPTIGAYEMNDMYDRDGMGQQMQAAQPVYEHPCAALSKIMSSGTFYYASDGKWDISTRLQARTKRQTQHDHSVYDPRFIWNEYIVGSLMDFRSRLDPSERDDLDTCHFIILAIQGYVGLHSIPLPASPRSGGPAIATIGMISRLGWKRAGTRFNTREWTMMEMLQILSRLKRCLLLTMRRGHTLKFVAVYPQQGLQIGGQRIQITRAQGASQPAFERHFAQLIEEYEIVHIVNLLGTKENEAALTSAYTAHLQTLRASGNAEISMSNLDFHAVVRTAGHDNGLLNYGFTSVEHTDNALITPQVGVFRTNCLDCLDRTNFIQDIISKLNLEHYLRNVRNPPTNAKSLLEHGTLMESPQLINYYLGYFPEQIVPRFQEIVPLTAQQIVQTDPEKKRMWEDYILDTLATRRDRNSDYVVLRSEQLVGTALILLCKTEATAHIRNVEAATRKTGLGGMSGNKGAVGIRLDYYDSSFCFITAHLAAGHINVEERNSDYRTIANGLSFLRGKTIGSHENVIWLADTNYRINLDNSEVRYLAANDQLGVLYDADQLKLAMEAQVAFMGYDEGPILFRPTYRYDLNSDEYDTSEKQRIPAWTDRVLYRGTGLDLAVYNRAELKQSDHRPIYAIFHATVRVIDVAKKDALQSQLLEELIHTNSGQTLDQKLSTMSIKTGVARTPPPPPPPRLPERPSRHNTLGPPEGILTVSKPASSRYPSPQPKDPFDSDEHSASSSEEELYRSSLMVPIEPTPISNSTVRAWPVKLPGSRSVSETRSTPDIVRQPTSDTHTLSSSTSFERVEIPNSLKEGGLQTATEEEVHRPVSVAA